jgi:hypothetical protein
MMNLIKAKSPKPHLSAWKLGECLIFVGKEPFLKDGKSGWHLSISHESRYPTWDEIKEARYRLCPANINMAMFLPPKSEYVNIHENCFHLWQVEEER